MRCEHTNRRNINESHMCIGIACRHVWRKPTAIFTSSGQLCLAELLNCRHNFGHSLCDRKKEQSPSSACLRSGCHRTNHHCKAVHASMQLMTASQANPNVKRSSAPVWIDCDAGADDALGIAWLLASPEEHMDKPIPMAPYINKASAGILLAAQANVRGISSVRGNTVGGDTKCSCRPVELLSNKYHKFARLQSKCPRMSSGH